MYFQMKKYKWLMSSGIFSLLGIIFFSDFDTDSPALSTKLNI
jgi:hypothetical protein